MQNFMEILKVYLDPLIFSVLGFMAILVVYFSIERAIFFSRIVLEQYTDVKKLEEDVSKNLTLLYIVYSNAPYVGLLGTVVGIMVVFYDMSGSGNIDVKNYYKGKIIVGCEFKCYLESFDIPIEILGYGLDLNIIKAYLKKNDIMKVLWIVCSQLLQTDSGVMSDLLEMQHFVDLDSVRMWRHGDYLRSDIMLLVILHGI